jgi:aryl carrier-like protein
MRIYAVDNRVTTRDLTDLGISSRDAVQIVQVLEQRWRENGYRMTKTQLLDSLFIED